MSRKIVGITVGTPLKPEKIAEKIENGTTLPMVTEQDNGKVLTVQGGKWLAQEDEEPLTNMEIENLLNNFT